MQRFLFILIFSAVFNSLSAQIIALTEDGRQVILNEDGTWKYDDSTISGTEDSIAVNDKVFAKTPGSTFLVKSKVFNVGVYIDPSIWTFSVHKDNEPSPEYRFEMKSADGYAMMITEKTPISIEAMVSIALTNAQKASYDARETQKEYRTVNGKKILFLKIEGTIKSIQFIYAGYYYSNENGTVQLVAYTSKQLFGGLQNAMEKFLNGLTETN